MACTIARDETIGGCGHNPAIASVLFCEASIRDKIERLLGANDVMELQVPMVESDMCEKLSFPDQKAGSKSVPGEPSGPCLCIR